MANQIITTTCVIDCSLISNTNRLILILIDIDCYQLSSIIDFIDLTCWVKMYVTCSRKEPLSELKLSQSIKLIMKDDAIMAEGYLNTANVSY